MNQVLKVNTQGGIFTPNKLKEIVHLAQRIGAKTINFGPRQEIYFNIGKDNLAIFENEARRLEIDFESNQDTYPNIVSSYPAEGIFSGDYWLTEGIYKDIFDQFDHQPRLKINIVDNDQCLVPFFSGELNFIASDHYNYWYLFVNFKFANKITQWNQLIYSTDIAKISREIEELCLNNKMTDVHAMMQMITENASYLSKQVDKELQLPRFVFPYYEGINKYGDKYWLGVYRRDYQFPIQFIIDLCMLCNETKIGQLCITPWRTLIIKGIEQSDRIRWEKLLGKHGVNLRHTATELNWVVEDINSAELDIKQHIIREFDTIDLRTFGLVFGIKLQSGSYIPASVIIEEIPFPQMDNQRIMSNFDIYFKEDFNPNSIHKKLFAQNIPKSDLAKKLQELIRSFYDQLTEETSAVKLDEAVTKSSTVKEKINIYQCTQCLSTYDSRYGDATNEIPPETNFEDVPATYTCPLCDAGKEKYVLLTEENFIFT